MDDSVQEIFREAIIKIIQETASPRSIKKLRQIHENKVHFVPAQYRVLGGLLQSLNIKFGNFIEELFALIAEKDPKIETLPLSGKHVLFSMTAQTDSLIDQYITERQLPNSPDSCDQPFSDLLNHIINIENNSTNHKQVITKDVDTLFQTPSGQIIYIEIKYNDDHDTGKFVDINRKFIKTYAGLVNKLDIKNQNQLKPILYYFNPKKRWGPIYVPSSNIYRGAQLFDEFFTTNFSDIELYLRNLGNDDSIISIFDRLYRQIRFDNQQASNESSSE